MTGQQKCELYAKYKISLRNALKYEFWLQAIFIEYAMLEDRTESVIRHAGNIKLINSRNQPLTLSEKINKIRSCSAFSDRKVRKYIPLDFLDEIMSWKRKRDRLIHSLMKLQNEDNEVKQIAIEGEALLRKVDNRIKSVNRRFDNNMIIEEK